MARPIATVAPDALDGKEVQSYPSDDGTYSVWIDLNLERGKYGGFTFNLYLRPSASEGQTLYEYEVDENPTGVFNDVVKPVTLHIGKSNSTVTSKLALHSAYGPLQALSYAPSTPGTIQGVSLGSSYSFKVQLDNNLQDMAASLGSATVTAGCTRCWRKPAEVNFLDNPLKPRGHTEAAITVYPNTLYALGTTATLLNPNVQQDALTLSFAVTATGGVAGTQSIDVPIRFTPPLPYLGLATLLGAVLGGCLRMLLAAGPRDRKLMMLGSIYAVVCELLAIVFFEYTATTIKIAGVNFDPTQILPAFVLCVLVGGGPTLIKAMKEIFGK
jgi:hypothetical protein